MQTSPLSLLHLDQLLLLEDFFIVGQCYMWCISEGTSHMCIIWVILNVFNDAALTSEFFQSRVNTSERGYSHLVNSKGLRRRRSWPVQDTILVFF